MQELFCLQAPRVGFVKINFDVAIRNSYAHVIACICYDHLGRAIGARAELIPQMCPVLAEAMATRMAAGEAETQNLEQVIRGGFTSCYQMNL